MLIRPARALPVLCVGLSALVAAATATASEPSASERAASVACGFLRVDLEPEGSGGAMGIRATGVSCRTARRIVARCVRGRVTRGWTVVTETRTLMTKGRQRIIYTPVGGGGCGKLVQACPDFTHRGVGFFNLRVLGPSCSGGRRLARSWFDSDDCSFGKACTISRYRCTPRPNSATITCRRARTGDRVEWQMGE